MGGKGLSRVSVAFLASVLVVAVFASVAARPAFFYDEERDLEERDLFRWTDGGFDFSREDADWELLRRRGRLRET